MKIFDKESNEDFKELYLLFTPGEALELSSEFKKLLEDPSQFTIILRGEDIDGKLSKKISIKILFPQEF